jgi:ribokinase
MHFEASMLPDEPRPDEVWVAQFETPLAATQEILARAHAAGARTVLNMAPFAEYPAELLKSVDVAVLNEIELSQATGTKLEASSPHEAVVAACNVLRERGARAVIATLGARGAVVVSAAGIDSIPAFQAKVVDTTGAGDCFVGALASRLAAGLTPAEAARFASVAASCSVERLGAAPAMPTGEEVAARLAKA